MTGKISGNVRASEHLLAHPWRTPFSFLGGAEVPPLKAGKLDNYTNSLSNRMEIVERPENLPRSGLGLSREEARV